MDIRRLFKDYCHQLQELYPSYEAESLVYLLFEYFLKLKRTDLLKENNIDVIPQALEQARMKLMEGIPFQYIVQSAPFYGRDFMVNPSVLIPRNETEELVHLILNENKGKGLKIMDLGTGSGCIPITLALEMDHPAIIAVDISRAALELAKFNAHTFESRVAFYQLDILNEGFPERNLDILISNPPYVRVSEKQSMHQNVLDHEPHLALFVTDEDPLVFYRSIAIKGREALKSGGKLYLEINAALGQQVIELLSSSNYSEIRLIKDLNGKDRMVAAVKDE